MKLPVTPQLSTKDGISNKNSRLTNVLKEKTTIAELAQVRPGLRAIAATSTADAGGGLVCYDGNLISIFGANFCVGTQTVAGAAGLVELATPIRGVWLGASYTGGKYLVWGSTLNSSGVDYCRVIAGNTLDALEEITFFSSIVGSIGQIVYFNSTFHVFRYFGGVTAYYTSPDLVTWTTRAFPSGQNFLDAAVFNGYLCVCASSIDDVVNKSGIRYSADGINWTTVITNTGYSYSGKFAVSGTRIVFADAIQVVRSLNGTVWTTVDVGLDYIVHSHVRHKTLFYALMEDANNGLYSVYMTASTGGTWTEGDWGLPFADAATLATDQTTLLAAEWAGTGVYTSTDDGVTWTFTDYSLDFLNQISVVAVVNGFQLVLTIGDAAGTPNPIYCLNFSTSETQPAPVAPVIDATYDFVQSPL